MEPNNSKHVGSRSIGGEGDAKEERKNIQNELCNLKGKYEEMARKMGTSSSIDQLLTITGLPYSEEVMAMHLLPNFWVPVMEMYNGTTDPLKHLETLKAHMTLHSFPGEVACRALPLTLKGLARVWFGSLVPGSIDSFGKLS